MAAFAATTPSLKVRALNDTRERRRRDPPALSDLARIGTMDNSRQSRKKKPYPHAGVSPWTRAATPGDLRDPDPTRD